MRLELSVEARGPVLSVLLSDFIQTNSIAQVRGVGKLTLIVINDGSLLLKFNCFRCSLFARHISTLVDGLP